MTEKAKTPLPKQRNLVVPIMVSLAVIVGFVVMNEVRQRKARRDNIQIILDHGGRVTLDLLIPAGINPPLRANDLEEARRRGVSLDSLPIGVVDLGDNQVHREVMQAVAELPQIRSLVLNNAQLDDKAWRIFSELGNAEDIWIGGDDCTPTRISQLGRLSGIKELSIWNTQLSEASCEAIANLDSLEELKLRYVKVDNSSLAKLSKLHQLRSFTLASPSEDSETNDETLQFLSALPNLTSLSIESCTFTNEGIRHIAPLKKLESLYIVRVPIDDKAFIYMEKMASLKNLYLGVTSVACESADCFAPLWRLRHLVIDGSPVSDSSLGNFRGLHHLNEIGLVDTEITAEGLDSLRRSLPTVRIRDSAL